MTRDDDRGRNLHSCKEAILANADKSPADPRAHGVALGAVTPVGEGQNGSVEKVTSGHSPGS